MAFLYIFLSVSLGGAVILCLKTYWQKGIDVLNGQNRIVSPVFLFFPSSYLVGTLILSWITYFAATMFKDYKDPLLYANIISLIISMLVLAVLAVLSRKPLRRFIYEFKKYGIGFKLNSSEWFIIVSSFIFWTYFICRSFYMKYDTLHVGVSAFSDFGAHLPVIRSFSVGKNFPAQYPHFPDGTMRYHFMFYFMAANLEYLGLSLPQALNIPSILSLVSFSMLLYALAAFLTKKPSAGILTCFLFAFRSSFAFFTFIDGFSNANDFINAIAKNLDADGKHREHIGNTMNESWGLWAQKVYINQRHLSFAFGLFILVLFLMLPLFIETMERIAKPHKAGRSGKNRPKQKESIFHHYIKTVLFSREAWIVESLIPCIMSGIILGLTAYWNGAVVIAGISVLFIMAALSRQKIGYLVTATITSVLSVIQTRIFSGNGTGVVSFKYTPGFLAESGSLKHIFSYYTELLGMLPFILGGILIYFSSRSKKWAGYFLSILFVLLLKMFMPSIGLLWTLLAILPVILCYACLIYARCVDIKKISLWLIPVFIAPVILATTLQLTPDITVNHKYIILSVILLNIPVSDLLTGLFTTKTSFIVSLCLVLLLTCTGFVDLITLYNLDKGSVSYNQKKNLQVWVENETNPEDIFLTHYMTHYGAPMSIMLAGRSVYNGYPYFTVTAGYDISKREECMKRIYSATDIDELRNLAVSEGIDYIVIEEQNRTAEDYVLNEEIFYETFDTVFQDNGITVFKVKKFECFGGS
ncbi:MAG: hypothetical protein GXZ01_04300 [Clostridiaceae bacterium]|nr:hypothetical protein [Clostridiaceae bacterium]